MRPSVLGERQIPDPNRTEHVVLGQRETVVGQVRLRADDDEVVVVTLSPQLLRGPQARQRGADHGDPARVTPRAGVWASTVCARAGESPAHAARCAAVENFVWHPRPARPRTIRQFGRPCRVVTLEATAKTSRMPSGSRNCWNQRGQHFAPINASSTPPAGPAPPDSVLAEL
jgi:hypothetical protein